MMTMFSLAFATVLSLLIYCITHMEPGQSRSLSSIAALGFGALDTRTIIGYNAASLVGNTLIANSPQVVLSLVYFSYNSLCTCMLLGQEWVTYSYQHKGLRVSKFPVGAQRSSYLLSLPYRFALPLMVLSGLLHWFVSQSIFFVAIEFYGYNDRINPRATMYSCGYSPIAMIVVLVLGSFMLLSAIGFGFIPFRSGVNLVGSCSALISAACHASASGEESGQKLSGGRLQWGAVGFGPDGVGHCAFAREVVQPLEERKMYAG